MTLQEGVLRILSQVGSHHMAGVGEEQQFEKQENSLGHLLVGQRIQDVLEVYPVESFGQGEVDHCWLKGAYYPHLVHPARMVVVRSFLEEASSDFVGGNRYPSAPGCFCLHPSRNHAWDYAYLSAMETVACLLENPPNCLFLFSYQRFSFLDLHLSVLHPFRHHRRHQVQSWG